MSHNTGIFVTSVITSNPIFFLAVARCAAATDDILLRCVLCTSRGSTVRGLCITKCGT
jgi:hypothetical protein